MRTFIVDGSYRDLIWIDMMSFGMLNRSLMGFICSC